MLNFEAIRSLLFKQHLKINFILKYLQKLKSSNLFWSKNNKIVRQTEKETP